MIGDFSPVPFTSAQSQRQPMAEISNEVQARESLIEKRSIPEEISNANQSLKRQKKKIDGNGRVSELQKLLRLDDDKESYRLIRVFIIFMTG